MALTLNDVEKIARLSHRTLTTAARTLPRLKRHLRRSRKMQSVNTDGIEEPMAHP